MSGHCVWISKDMEEKAGSKRETRREKEDWNDGKVYPRQQSVELRKVLTLGYEKKIQKNKSNSFQKLNIQ